ncbi:MAG TPA: glycosyltransferase family 4 protein, partial [Marmoricola sp.]
RTISAAVRHRARPQAPVAQQQAPAPSAPIPELVCPVETAVIEHPSHIGPMMDGYVARAKRHQRPVGEDVDYDLVREHFDYYNFLMTAPQLRERPDLDPIDQLIDRGPRIKHNADINFSMSAYLKRHPERANGAGTSPYVAWLRRGRAAGEIADPAQGIELMAPLLGMEPGEVVDQLARTRTDLQERLRYGKLGEMFAKAAQIEPQIAQAWPRTAQPVLYPFASAQVAAQAAALERCHALADFRTARLVIVVISPRWGAGRRIEGHIAHAVASRIDPSEIVVVYTDGSGAAPADRFPAGVRQVDLAGVAERTDLDRDSAARVLVELIRSLRADAVVNVNSTLFYEALQFYDRALALSERIFHVMFCNDQGQLGNWGGHPLKHFYRCIDSATGVITDSEHLRSWFVDFFQLGERVDAKLHVLAAPVDERIPVAPVADRGGRRPQVFWAGRFDRQKKLPLVFAIARRMPDVDFRLWGESVQQSGPIHALPDNISLEGAYTEFEALDLSTADAWLYTSGWDGVPSQLLEVAMTGVPIVGSGVGGTTEVLDPSGSWPIDDVEDPDAYVAAIREILAAPGPARERALHLRELLRSERTTSAYAAATMHALFGEE